MSWVGVSYGTSWIYNTCGKQVRNPNKAVKVIELDDRKLEVTFDSKCL